MSPLTEPLTLAFDTATVGCSVAVVRGETPLAEIRECMRRGQAERLLPMIGEVLEQAAIDYSAIDRIAVTTGPGTFTGIRLGLAAARGLALALDRPVAGSSGLVAMAAEVAASTLTDSPFLVAIDSRRQSAFIQAFAADGTAMNAPVEHEEAALRAILAETPQPIAGDAAAAISAANPGCIRLPIDRPSPAFIARCAFARAAEPWQLRPIYVRPPDATPMPVP